MYHLLLLTMPVTNNTASNKYIYIKSIALTKSNVGTLNNNSLFDYLSGMSGTVLGTTTGTMVQLIGWESSMYEVIITCYGNFTAFVTKSNGSFTITTSKNHYKYNCDNKGKVIGEIKEQDLWLKPYAIQNILITSTKI